jgi:hypothetical protein
MQEIQQFDQIFKNIAVDGISYSTHCEKTKGSAYCFQAHEQPLSFWETANHQYNVDAATPYQVIYRIQLGRGPEVLYPTYDPHFIPVRDTFSGRLPSNLTVESSGANDVRVM